VRDRHWQRLIRVIGVSLVLAAASSAVAAAAQAAPATTRTWRLVFRAPVNPDAKREIQGITAASRNDAWAFGGVYDRHNTLLRSFYLRWGGRRWALARIRAAAGFTPVQIGSSSADNVWIFGYRTSNPLTGQALAFDGSRWHSIASPWQTGGDFESDVVVSPTDVWRVSDSSCGTSGSATTVAHWSGAGWKIYPVPGCLQLAGGGSRPWLVGMVNLPGKTGGTGEVAFHWNGSSWRPVNTPDRSVRAVVGVASPAGRLWLAAKRAGLRTWVLHVRQGATWARLPSPPRFAFDVAAPPVFDGHDGIWSLPFHWTGARWINTTPRLAPPPGWFNEFWYDNVAPIPGTSSAWAIVLANRRPYTLGTQQSGIARYSP